MAEEVFKPGDKVPRSGIYQVTHYQHRIPHEAVVTAMQPFPVCRICGARVRYRLARGAEPIERDRDFSDSKAAGGQR
jgi:hypothetical protein